MRYNLLGVFRCRAHHRHDITLLEDETVPNNQDMVIDVPVSYDGAAPIVSVD